MYTVENPGEGMAQIFAKIHGVNAFWAKSQGGKHTILGFIDFLFFENLIVGVLCYPQPSPFPMMHL
jgi:hypothetical protein